MSIASWFRKLRARDDEARIKQVMEMQDETPAERRRFESGEWETLAADEVSARALHEPTMDDANRLGDRN